jgi:hypothetical protein
VTEAAIRFLQVETIKKLANSRMANITKGFEEKLSLKEKEFEELQMQVRRGVLRGWGLGYGVFRESRGRVSKQEILGFRV